jgi:hypothetical protein
MFTSLGIVYMTQKVNMYADPSRDSDTLVFTLENSEVDSEALTQEVLSRVDHLDEYLERHFETEQTESGFIGTVDVEEDGHIGRVNISNRVRENPIA